MNACNYDGGEGVVVVVARTGLERLMEGVGTGETARWGGERGEGQYSGCDRLGLKGRGGRWLGGEPHALCTQ